MEYAKKEIAVLEQAVADAAEEQIRELNELQLLLVGGGSGDVVFH